jgi:LPS O-antigen subunit length determinant protein (WzzB/FepE family)
MRALICILGTMLGGMIGMIYVLGRAHFRPQAA